MIKEHLLNDLLLDDPEGDINDIKRRVPGTRVRNKFTKGVTGIIIAGSPVYTGSVSVLWNGVVNPSFRELVEEDMKNQIQEEIDREIMLHMKLATENER